MRGTRSFVALLSAGMASTASGAVIAATGLTASANGWDARIEGYGCPPSGCVPANAIDGSIDPNSRWSCKAQLAGGDACELTLALAAPTDIVEIRIALYKGDLRTRTINILVDGVLATVVEASGTTTDYESYVLIALQASTVSLQSSGMEENGWLSTVGVQLMMESVIPVPTPAPIPSLPTSAVTPVPTPAPIPSLPTSGATTAPTPSIAISECPIGSIQSSLEITLSWESSDDLDLWVQEPGGDMVSFSNRLGDVGMASLDDVRGPGTETFTLLNGLSVANDNVLGDYTAWVSLGNGDDGTEYLVTARSGGKLLWAVAGMAVDNTDENARYTAIVSEYTESDCSIDAYGNCPAGAFSSDGLAPCTACAPGDVSVEGATSCTLGALDGIDVSEALAKAIVADAVGGFAGPGDVGLDGDARTYDRFIIGEDEAGTLELSGIFERDDNALLPASTALFVYIVDDDADTFVQSQGDIDSASGGFTVTANDVPVGFSRAILSFVVIDPADAPDEQGADSVFALDVVNGGCNSPLTFTLEWDTNNSDFDLYITEPNGNSVNGGESGDFGYTTSDVQDGFGPETYTVFGGDQSAVGQYSARVRTRSAPTDTTWTLTARVNGVVAWVEQGMYTAGDFSYGFSDDSSNSLTYFVTVAAGSILDAAC